eukprot:4400842-Prorocentrum_lima.AAC.1
MCEAHSVWLENNATCEIRKTKLRTDSPTIQQILSDRAKAWEQGDVPLANLLTKDLRKQNKWERKQALIYSVRKELDVRDQWLGLRQLKREFTPTPFAKKTAQGHHVKMEEAAQQAASYLQDRHWARPLEIPPLRRLYKVIHDDVIVDTADFRVAEITVAISSLKKRKATG